MNTQHHIQILLPTWLTTMLPTLNTTYPSIATRMERVIQLAKSNTDHATGGPFAAAIFNRDTDQLIAVGVNVVVASHCSMAHAEMMAISSAQQQLSSFDLSSAGRFELVTSCEPCAMCFGAIPWSGISHLVCGARDADARAIGFDEGPKMATWQHELKKRGITVETDVCRQDAIDVLQHYASTNGNIYNSRNPL